jgi:hypothetical protein
MHLWLNKLHLLRRRNLKKWVIFLWGFNNSVFLYAISLTLMTPWNIFHPISFTIGFLCSGYAFHIMTQLVNNECTDKNEDKWEIAFNTLKVVTYWYSFAFSAMGVAYFVKVKIPTIEASIFSLIFLALFYLFGILRGTFKFESLYRDSPIIRTHGKCCVHCKENRSDRDNHL